MQTGGKQNLLSLFMPEKAQHDNTQAEPNFLLSGSTIVASFAFPSQVAPTLEPLLQNLFYSIWPRRWGMELVPQCFDLMSS